MFFNFLHAKQQEKIFISDITCSTFWTKLLNATSVLGPLFHLTHRPLSLFRQVLYLTRLSSMPLVLIHEVTAALNAAQIAK